MAHTKGPWKWVVNGREIDIKTYHSPGYYDNPELYGPQGEPILTCGEYSFHKYPEDALLIAAAPELLAACRALISGDPSHKSWGSFIEKARAAISKSESK